MKIDDQSERFERLKERGREIAWAIDKLVNPDMVDARDVAHRTTGFALLLFPFGEAGDATYISNADRDDMIRAVEEWLRHIKRTRSRS